MGYVTAKAFSTALRGRTRVTGSTENDTAKYTTSRPNDSSPCASHLIMWNSQGSLQYRQAGTQNTERSAVYVGGFNNNKRHGEGKMVYA